MQLQPGQTYSYRVGDPSGGWSDVFTYHALPADIGSEARPLRLLQVADMAYDNASDHTVAAMQAEVSAGLVDLVLHPGDVSYVSRHTASPCVAPHAPSGRRRHASLGRLPRQDSGSLPLMTARAMPCCADAYSSTSPALCRTWSRPATTRSGTILAPTRRTSGHRCPPRRRTLMQL